MWLAACLTFDLTLLSHSEMEMEGALRRRRCCGCVLFVLPPQHPCRGLLQSRPPFFPIVRLVKIRLVFATMRKKAFFRVIALFCVPHVFVGCFFARLYFR